MEEFHSQCSYKIVLILIECIIRSYDFTRKYKIVLCGAWMYFIPLDQLRNILYLSKPRSLKHLHLARGGAEATCQNLDRDACPIFFSLKLNQILLFWVDNFWIIFGAFVKFSPFLGLIYFLDHAIFFGFPIFVSQTWIL